MTTNNYNTLIGKRITVQFNGALMNAYRIENITALGRELAGRGEMYECTVKWENEEKQGSYPQLLLDKTTLDELSEKNISVNPMMCNLYYVVENVVTEDSTIGVMDISCDTLTLGGGAVEGAINSNPTATC